MPPCRARAACAASGEPTTTWSTRAARCRSRRARAPATGTRTRRRSRASCEVRSVRRSYTTRRPERSGRLITAPSGSSPTTHTTSACAAAPSSRRPHSSSSASSRPISCTWRRTLVRVGSGASSSRPCRAVRVPLRSRAAASAAVVVARSPRAGALRLRRAASATRSAGAAASSWNAGGRERSWGIGSGHGQRTTRTGPIRLTSSPCGPTGPCPDAPARPTSVTSHPPADASRATVAARRSATGSDAVRTRSLGVRWIPSLRAGPPPPWSPTGRTRSSPRRPPPSPGPGAS